MTLIVGKGWEVVAMKVILAHVAQIFGMTIAQAHGIFKTGIVDFETAVEYAEKHSGSMNYERWIAALERLERRAMENHHNLPIILEEQDEGRYKDL